MEKANPLRQFQAGVQLAHPEVFVPWAITKDDFLQLLPHDSVTWQNKYWVSSKCRLLGLDRELDFNFVPHPQAVFHEIQFNDRGSGTLREQHTYFEDALRLALGQPTFEHNDHLRWHDDTIVIDLDISDVSDTPDGTTYPRFLFQLQNSKLYPPHWNNRPQRPSGFERRG